MGGTDADRPRNPGRTGQHPCASRPGRHPRALESIGLEAYRQRRITGYQFRTLLGIHSRYEFDGFLEEHRVEKYTAEDFEPDLATIVEMDKIRKAERQA